MFMWATVDLWEPGEDMHVGRGKIVWSCIKQLSWDSNWKSWEYFEYCLKLFKACKGVCMCVFVCNLYSLQKLPTSDSLFLKARLLHRTKFCFQTLQPSRASIFSWPKACTALPICLVVMPIFWGRFLSCRAFKFTEWLLLPLPLHQ